MGGWTSSRLVESVLSLPPVWLYLWLGLVALSIALLVLMRTNWGQSRPLHKCAALSLLAHVLLAWFATTVRLVTDTGGMPEAPAIRLALNTESADAKDAAARRERPLQPWDPQAGAFTEADAELPRPEAPPQPSDRVASLDPVATGVDSPPVGRAETDLPERMPLEPGKRASSHQQAEAIEAPAAESRPAAEVSLPEASDASPRDKQESSGTPKRTADRALPEALLDPAALTVNRTGQDSAEEAAPTLQPVPLARTRSPAPAAPSFDPEPEAAPARNAADVLGQMARVPSRREREAALSAAEKASGSRDDYQPPAIYRQRSAVDRDLVTQARGGGPETEAAVEAALRWLAVHQNPDGSWNARRFGAGQEQKVLGHDRQGAGADADTGISALAILAFLGAGHTHRNGPYDEVVRSGLAYLQSQQRDNGDLAGPARMFARMYCHSMAAFALSEAYAMTGDEDLAGPVKSAVAYTVGAQHPALGGWRYQPGDTGDTSQLGWQVMALKSAELAGVPIPAATRSGIERFLTSVSAGQHGGLASYRPGHMVSRTMTAEALFCRQLTGANPTRESVNEGAMYLMGELPGQGRPNYYYWYYATLSLYQEQGEAWNRWNDALKPALLGTQRNDGDLAGSWDPNSVWGGYGGRVYTTSLGALCLEVYYRYLPLYAEAARRQNGAAPR